MMKALNLFPLLSPSHIKNIEQGKRNESNFHHLLKSLNENGIKQHETEQFQDVFVHTLTTFLKLTEEVKKLALASEEDENSIDRLSMETMEMRMILQPLMNEIHEEWKNHGLPVGIEKNQLIEKWLQSFEANKSFASVGETTKPILSLDNLIQMNEGVQDGREKGFAHTLNVKQASALIERVLAYIDQVNKSDRTIHEQNMGKLIDFRHVVERLLEEKHIPKLIKTIQNGVYHPVEKLEKALLANAQNINVKEQSQRDPDKMDPREKNVDHLSQSLFPNRRMKGEGISIGEWLLTLTTLKDNGASPSTPSTQQEFVQKFLDIMKLSKHFKTIDGKQTMTIRLNPEHLGTLTVKLTVESNESVAKIIASTQSAKELLEHSIHQLKQALPNTEIEINRFELLEEQQMSLFREHQDENSQHQERKQKDEKQEERTESFQEKLNEQLNFIV
ncbi:flagellar hook-length control protein FliK [Bacillus sp. FJAT-47783]|uniref:flagellar hook-length control protein FliK n=1 Tax=Bacillus sp. FJAT-47783 TaxID=2922712 RepID=UPI001FAE55B6|nr:flagellar hook-length control protein FliK [Bacillus sp. FJAT-47783]